MTEIMQPIPARLKNVAVGGHVAGADQIIDDEQNKTQETINSEVLTALGTGGSVDEKIAEAVGGEETRAQGAETALGNRTTSLEQAVGNGGSVDTRISNAVDAAKSDLKGNATSACDTLGEAEALIAAEATRASAAEVALDTAKADKATTLAGYGITDAYNKSETYSKTEINDHIDTPNQGYITAAADSNTTTANLKTLIDTAAGSDKEKADFIYRVGSWDGSQYDETVYSEYAWNGTDYIFLSKKSQVDEVFDISAYHANTPYADLTAALGTNGANIPQALRKGGMSIKFIQGSVGSSDNKYVEFRNTGFIFSTDEWDWQGVINTVIADDNNLVNGAGIANAIARKGCLVDFSEGKYDVSDAILFLKINQIWDANKIYTIQQYNPSIHAFAIYVKDGDSFTAYAACNEGNATSHTGDIYTWIFGQSEIIIDFSQSSKSYGNGSVNFNNRIREICFINPNIPRIDDSLNEIRNTIFLGKSTAQYDNVYIPNKTLNTQFSPDFQRNNDFCSFIFTIKKGTTITLRNTTVPSGAKYLYIINGSGTITDMVEFTVGDISYTAASDVTVAFSLYKTCYCIVPEYYGMKGLSHQIDVFNIDIEPYKHLNKLLNQNGNLIDIGGFWMTFHKIPVIKGSTVKADFPNVEISAGYPIIILYDLDGNVVTKIEYSEATRLNHLEMIASVDGYFSVISCTSAYSLDSNPSVTLSPSFVTVNQLNYNFFNLITNNRERLLKLEDKNDYLFNNQSFESIYKFGIIGDSLSVGFMTNPVDNVQISRNLRFSWGQIIARKNGQECLNFGVAGASPWSWYNKSDQVDLCKNLMINPNMLCQCYIIGLGVNTDAVYNIDTVGSLSDIDWNDKDNNANSWYGNYAKILQLIRETAPQAVIFTLTRPAPREENTVNTMIREISNDSHLSSNVFLVDIASAKYNKYFEAIVGYYYEAHHTAAGYACCGEIIEKAISDVMLANATNAAIRSIGFIPYGNGTNP